jgi:hypothetical protein
MRFRLAVVSAVAISLAAFLCAGQARAAAEVHRFSLMLSAIPTSITGGDYNDQLDRYNLTVLDPKGFSELDHIQFTWAYDAELRYFARPNFALVVGVTQLKADQTKSYLPAISQEVALNAEILTVPVHIGGAYYMQPYNQGDFQARAFVGGGFLQYTHTRASFEQNLSNPDSVLNSVWNGSSKVVLTQDAPGYYLEGGAHMFFASRYSVLISAVYRSGLLNNMRLATQLQNGALVSTSNPGPVVNNSKGGPYQLDVGGLGLRMALGIGF